jgi:NADP-dependent 3-hydroxy acid dehydrogenase YdfG
MSSPAQAKIVIITGATGVLGRKTAQAFAERGHSLVVLGNDQAKLDSLVRDLNLPAERLLASIVDLRDSISTCGRRFTCSTRFRHFWPKASGDA